MKEANILPGIMCQILHPRNSGASVSDEEAERAALDDWLMQLKDVGGGTGNSISILAPPPLHDIHTKSLFPKVDHSFVR